MAQRDLFNFRGSCIILQISNGAFTKAVEKKKWTFLSYDRWTEYEKISLGRTINPGSSVHVSCDAGYSFQGKGRNDVSVKCSFGEWDKDPVCLVRNYVYDGRMVISDESRKERVLSSKAVNCKLRVNSE
ncbi:protein lev-9 [Trichonephila inaurata madagascariensis]|uniref:Protein lev-9 n=1 Tax=Trichonephila inaurata madagascariensis TaxID=2747483 RepID=A0A8X6YDI2_9ARAC|nr:protein lev-9 [Trichonephila inaurata madagascariensis]